MQQPPRAEPVAQAPDQLVGEPPLGRADGGDVPFGRFEIVHRHEGRLAAHGQAHVLRGEVGVDPLAQRVHGRPDLVGERLGDPRRLGDAGDGHVEAELGLGRLDAPEIGAAELVVRGRGERDVALAGEQPRGRVQADPAGARQVDLGPGVQVGEVRRGAGRARRPRWCRARAGSGSRRRIGRRGRSGAGPARAATPNRGRNRS